MTRSGPSLASLREEALTEAASFLDGHAAAQSGLARAHIEAAREAGVPLIAGATVLAFGRALGLSPRETRQLACVAQLVELAAAALAALPAGDPTGGVAARAGVPLALNSGDALYGLAHVALAEYQAGEGIAGQCSRVLDDAALHAWEVASRDGYFADPPAIAAEMATLAARLVAGAAGKDEATAAALAAFARALASGGSEASSRLAAAGLDPLERDALAQIAR